MFGADLSRANLFEVTLSGADLTSVDLSRANLRGARLDGALFDLVELNHAYFNDETVWPRALIRVSLRRSI